MSTPLDAISDLGLPVTLDVVRAGWDGIGDMPRQLMASDVADFACRQLAQPDSGDSADIANLCITTDSEEIDTALSRLVPVVSENAIRTWRAFLLAKLLGELPESPIDGLSELTSFWNALNFPDDMPHVVQGRNNDISPLDYYTEKNYQQIIQKHRDWLTSEISQLARASLP
jgi:hypothetical protein